MESPAGMAARRATRPPSLADLGERQRALDLALHERPLAAALGARLAIHLLLDVLVQLRDGHDAVAVAIGLAGEPLEQEVREHAVAQLRGLQRDLVGTARGDDHASPAAREPLEELVVDAAGADLLPHERAAARGTAVARVEEHDDALG